MYAGDAYYLITRNNKQTEFGIAKYEHMFAGEPVVTTLHVKDCTTSAVAGRLSAGDASVTNANSTSSVYTTVMESPASYGWLTQFGSDMAIEKSASLQESHLEYLRDIEATYGQGKQ